jgi:hypothetical protein
MKFNETAFAHAATAWMGLVYVFCVIAIALFPNLTRSVMESWFHGIDMSSLWTNAPISSSVFFGLFSALALTWVGAYLFAYLYNRLIAKK